MGNIADKMQYLLETKQHISDAIESKGVAVPSTVPFRGYAALIGSIADKKVSRLSIYKSIGKFAVDYDDGTTLTGTATFDENGLPTSLTDDNGNTVVFGENGYPTSARDSNGNTVPIVWG